MTIGFLATAALAAATPAQLDPIALFTQVCLSDQVSLPARSFADTPYASLPEGARKVLNLGAPHFFPAHAATLNQSLPVAEIPNRILASLPGRRLFLIVAVPGTSGRMAPACAVIWRGLEFDRARDALNASFHLPPGTESLRAIRGLNYIDMHQDGADVAAAELSGWTLLRASPDTAATTE
jgi:hypothetical protein